MLPFGNISERIFTHTASHYACKHTTILAIWQERKCRPRLPPVPSKRRAKQCRPPSLHLPQKAASEAMPPVRTAVCRQTTVTRAPRSRARLQHDTIRRRLMAKPCTPHFHCAARAVLQATNPQCRGSRGTPLVLLWGFKRGYSLREENTPFDCAVPWRCHPPAENP